MFSHGITVLGLFHSRSLGHYINITDMVIKWLKKLGWSLYINYLWILFKSFMNLQILINILVKTTFFDGKIQFFSSRT